MFDPSHFLTSLFDLMSISAVSRTVTIVSIFLFLQGMLRSRNLWLQISQANPYERHTWQMDYDPAHRTVRMLLGGILNVVIWWAWALVLSVIIYGLRWVVLG